MNKTRDRRTLGRALPARRMEIEALEARCVLSAAAPWHNDAVPLDVNDDGHIFPIDALSLVNRLNLVGISALEEPSGTPEFYYDTNADGMLTPLDLVRVFNGLLQPTTVVLDTLMPFTIDLTPRLEVFVAEGTSVPDGTAVHLDVDMNNDGAFTADELDYTVSSMYRGRSEFALGPALPANEGSETYSINLRARVANAAGVLTPTDVQPMIVDTQTSDALANYVNTPDASYTWSLVHQSVGPGDAYRYYVLSMTSQTWRLGDVNDAVWDHWLRIVVPAGELTDTAVLLISGGSNTAGMPTNFDPFAQKPSDEDVLLFATAVATHSMVIELKVVPNERVFFLAEPGTPSRTEDDIIAYTYDQYLEHIGEPGNETWPLLLPMVKSAVRAMDTIQSFSLIFAPDPIENFIVTGYSKRGWTTWLTTAFDDRIIASIPGVFDNPNQGPSMVHHYQVLGRFSEEVDPYSDMQIFERLLTPEAQLLSRIVDPYRYLRSGKFDDMPMLILNSAGDEFFMSDSSQYYFADLPGDDKYMRYIPNTGHGLDGRAVESTVAFSDAILNNRELPDFTWTVEPNGEIHVHTIDTPLQVKMWQATNPFARDFRNGYNPWIEWTSSVLADLGGGSYIGSVPYPETGATAFLIELTFASGVPGVPHVFTTDVRVNSDLPRTPFPYTADPLVATASNGITGTTFSDATLLTPVPLFALPATSDAAVPQTPSASSVEPPSLVQPSAVDVATTDTTDWLADEDDESFHDADEVDSEFDVDAPLDATVN